MLKKLFLGLLAFSVLVTPVRNGSTGKSEDSLSLNAQEKSTFNERFDRIGDFGVDDIGYKGGGFGYEGGGFGHESGGFLNDGLLLDINTFTISIKGSDTFYESNDGECLSRTKLGTGTYLYKIIVYNTVGVHKFVSHSVIAPRATRIVYSYLYKNVAYISEESKEDAWRLALQSDIESGALTDQEIENSYAEFLLLASPGCNQRGPETVPAHVLQSYVPNHQNSQYMTIYTWPQWEDRNHNWSALTMCKAALLLNGRVVKRGRLNEKGIVGFDFDSSSEYWGKTYTVEIYIYAESDTFAIGYNYSLVAGCLEENLIFASNPSIVTIDGSETMYYIPLDKPFENDERTSVLMSICQALALCERFANENVFIPSNGFHYADSSILNITVDNSCFFMSGDASTVPPLAYENWFLVFRLYGLHVQEIIGQLGSNNVIDYGPDFRNFVYNDNVLFGKDMALQSVWHKSLASMFAILAYYSLESEIADLYPTSGIRDYIQEINTYKPDEYSGEGSVLCTTVYLYNLYTGYIARDGKFVEGSESYANFFKSTFVYCAKTLYEYIKNYMPLDDIFLCRNSILLDSLNIAPNNLHLVNSLENGQCPIFEWNPGGCASHPNNTFDLYIYKNREDSIVKVEGISGTAHATSNGTISYTLSTKDTEKIYEEFDAGHNVCYAVVYGYQKMNGFESGPYYSMYCTVSKPIVPDMIINNETMSEKRVHFCFGEELPDGSYLHKGFADTTYVKFRNEGRVSFFTRGEIDTFISIYDAEEHFIASDDNGGYLNNAFVSCYVDRNKIYKVEVKVANNEWCNGWSHLDILQGYNSYNEDGSVNHPVSYDDIMRINYDPYYSLRPDYSPEVDYDYYNEFMVEEKNDAVLLFDSSMGAGYHLEIQYTEVINLTIIYLNDEVGSWNSECYSGASAYLLGYLDYYINIPANVSVMILVSRVNKFASIQAGLFSKAFRFKFGTTYQFGDW